MCETGPNDKKWFAANDVPCDIKGAYISKVRPSEYLNQCNIIKISITSCEVKVKTRGILLMIASCGVIVGYREICGSESITQEANMYLDMVELFKIIKFYFILFNYLESNIDFLLIIKGPIPNLWSMTMLVI